MNHIGKLRQIIIPKSIFRHFRNKKLYIIESVGFHTETLEEMVVYRQLYPLTDKQLEDNPRFNNYQTWIRSRKMFEEKVGVDENGDDIYRFQFVNNSFNLFSETDGSVDL